MKSVKSLFIVVITAAWGCVGYAQDVPLTNLTEDDLGKVVKEFSANFAHTSVSGAGTLGSIFGFEIGLVGGITKTPELDSLVKRADSTKDLEQVPHGAILGVLTVPLGITAEVGIIPKVGGDDFKFSSYSVAGKWTPTEILFELPLDLAAKGFVTKSNLEFEQTISNVPVEYEYENTTMGLVAFASKDFVFVAPYAGIGYVKAKGDLSFTGSTTVFNTSYTTGTSASKDETSAAIYLGSEFKILIFKAGLEYAKMFDTNSYTGKVSVYF